MMTVDQTTPVAFSVTVDRATAAMLALHARENPAQYAAGLLVRVCKTAVALKCPPHEVSTQAVVHACTCGL